VDAAAIPCAGLDRLQFTLSATCTLTPEIWSWFIGGSGGGRAGFAIQLAKRARSDPGNKLVRAAQTPITLRRLGADQVNRLPERKRIRASSRDRGVRGFLMRLSIISARGMASIICRLARTGGRAVAFIAGLPDLSRLDDLPYSIAIHDIGLGGVLVAAQFRRQQEESGPKWHPK